MFPQGYQYHFWTDFEDMQKIRKIWYYFRHETQNVKYVFLNTGSNKIIPLWFLCFRFTLYAVYTVAKIAIAHRWELRMVPSLGHRWAMAKRSADHRWAIDGNATVHRWPMDGLPWDPNLG